MEPALNLAHVIHLFSNCSLQSWSLNWAHIYLLPAYLTTSFLFALHFACFSIEGNAKTSCSYIKCKTSFVSLWSCTREQVQVILSANKVVPTEFVEWTAIRRRATWLSTDNSFFLYVQYRQEAYHSKVSPEDSKLAHSVMGFPLFLKNLFLIRVEVETRICELGLRRFYELDGCADKSLFCLVASENIELR